MPDAVLIRACVLVVLGLGCETDSLDWTVAFDDPADGERALGVRLAIARGGCPLEGDPLYTAEIRRGRSIPESGEIAPGAYAFAAEAYDERCMRIAGVCDPVTLPRDAPLASRLVHDGAPSACEACSPGFCESLRAADGGVPDGDVRPSCGESCTCDYDAVCDLACPVGTSCTLRCLNGSTCTLACPGRDCTVLCEDASCTIDPCGTGARCTSSRVGTLACGASCGEVRP